MTLRELLTKFINVEQIGGNAKYLFIKNELLSLPFSEPKEDLSYIYIGKVSEHFENKEDVYYEAVCIDKNKNKYSLDFMDWKDIIDSPILIESIEAYGINICATAILDELSYFGTSYVENKQNIQNKITEIELIVSDFATSKKEELNYFEKWIEEMEDISEIDRRTFDEKVDDSIIKYKDYFGNYLVFVLLNDINPSFKQFTAINSVFNMEEIFNLNHDYLYKKAKKGYAGEKLYNEFKKIAKNRIKIKKNYFIQQEREKEKIYK